MKIFNPLLHFPLSIRIGIPAMIFMGLVIDRIDLKLHNYVPLACKVRLALSYEWSEINIVF